MHTKLCVPYTRTLRDMYLNWALLNRYRTGTCTITTNKNIFFVIAGLFFRSRILVDYARQTGKGRRSRHKMAPIRNELCLDANKKRISATFHQNYDRICIDKESMWTIEVSDDVILGSIVGQVCIDVIIFTSIDCCLQLQAGV